MESMQCPSEVVTHCFPQWGSTLGNIKLPDMVPAPKASEGLEG